MIGSILINLLFGLVGFALTFFITYSNNLLGTSLLRGLTGFIVWFLLAFLLRWVLGFIVNQSSPQEEVAYEAEEEELGTKLDISTPSEDEELIDLLKPKPGQGQGNGNSEEFKPLTPPKLVSMKDPEELAKAVRHLKEE